MSAPEAAYSQYEPARQLGEAPHAPGAGVG